MAIKKTKGEKIFQVVNAILMVILIIITLYPILYVAFASLSKPSELIQHQGILWKPLGFSIEAYKMVFKNPMISIGYQNTLFYVVVGTAFNILLSCLGAYILSRKGLYIKKFLTVFIIFTMYFGGGLIPFYLLVKKLGLTNTRWALIIPRAINTWNLIVMRTAFASVPDSLEESARIDGAEDFSILFKIILPLVMPTIAVMVLFYAVAHWNGWFDAMVFLRKRELYPVQLILREILISNDTSSMMFNVSGVDKEPVGETIKYATIIITTLPILFIYPFLQKYFVKGIMVGAVKG
ncbi:carbohydrate ABC transporter permease [Xylanivirga thermophila]|uniref:carbohydrate ABC transporter permease n=1 Tax=Xylanivirga thermophila TaxID=2496273 RepID=UPI00101B72F8|nr:carbohydrate ABC transporter permease [Xylanivirga thermophila]